MAGKKKIILLSIITASFITALFMVYFVGPENLVSRLGITNSYLLIFALAVMGGVSSFTSGPFYAALTTLAAGGVNFFLLGVISGIGLLISDSIFYYFGSHAKNYLETQLKKPTIRRAVEWVEGQSDRKVQLFVFLYVGLTPLPNDIVTISLAIIGFPYKKILLPLMLGNITSTTIIAFLATQGIKLAQ